MKLSIKREAFATAFVLNGGNATQAATVAGYLQPASQGSRLLKDANVRAAIEAKHATTQVQIEYSHAEWQREVLETAREARELGKHGPALKGYELVGRAIGALSSEANISRDQAEFFSYLGAQMAEYGRAQLLNGSPVQPINSPALPAISESDVNGS